MARPRGRLIRPRPVVVIVGVAAVLLSLSPWVAPAGSTTTTTAGTTTTTTAVAIGSGGSGSLAMPVPVAGVDAFGIGAGQLDFPQGLAFDSKGDLFVADSGNSRVLEYSHNSNTSYSSAGTVVAAQLSSPGGIALDANGDLLVADVGGNDVVEYAYNASTGGYASSGTVVASAGTGDIQLTDPTGVAVDAKGDLFVAADNSVQEFAYNSASGTYASVGTDVAGTGTNGSATDQLYSPHGVALDANGDLFVVDTGNDRVMEYPFNSVTGTYATSGTEIAGSLPSGADFLAFDASGDLFVSYGSASGGGVLEFTYNSATATYASSGAAVGNVNNPASASGLAFNSSGGLFVAEATDLVLELVQTALLPTAAGFAPLGTIMGQQSVTNTGIGAIALDGEGNLFVSDNLSSNGPTGVFEFPYNSSTGTYSVTGAVVTKTGGAALAVDNNRDLFVAQSSGVVEYPWNSTSGSYPSSGSAVPGATELSALTVTAMAFDAQNDLFVGSGDQVLEFPYYPANGTSGASGSPANGTWAASGTIVATVTPGTLPSGYTSFIQGVAGIALDTNGDLFVSNPGATQVLEFAYNPSTFAYATSGTTVAGAGGTGNGSNQLYEPTGVAVDHSGDLFVFDAGNARVMEFTKVEGAVSYSESGTPVFSGNADSNPENGGVAVDSQGDVFFGNDYNTAVVYEAAAIPGGTTTTTGATTTSSTTTTTNSTTSTTRSTTTTTGATTTSTPPNGFPGWTAVTPPGGLFVGNGQDGPPISPVSCAPGTSHCVAVLGSTSVVTATGQIGQGVAVTPDLTDWTSYNSLPSQFTQVLSISCPTSTQCVAVGAGVSDSPVIAVSKNGGVGWTEANMSPFNPASDWPQAVTCPSALVCYTVGGTVGPAAPMAAISTDGGQDWTLLDKDLPTSQAYYLDAISCSSGSSCVAVGALSETGPATAISTTSSGTTWSQSGSSTLGQFGTLYSVSCPTGTTVCFAGGVRSEGPALASSTDSGTTWATVPLPSGDSGVSSISCANTLTCWAAGMGTTVSLAGTGNGGSTWQADTGGTTNQYDNVSCASTQVCIATADNQLWSTNDNGEVTPGTTTTTAPTTTTTSTTTTTTSTTTTTVAPTTTTTHATTTTVAPTTTTTHATTTTVSPTTTTVASANLIPDPGFETTAVPADYWGSTLALTTAVVRSGSAALAQTTTSTSGGWDLDDNPSWYAPVSSADTYSAAIWVRATAAVKVDIGVDLLTANGTYVDTANGPSVTLVANTWTELTVSGIKPNSTEVYAGMEPDFSNATKGTIIYWDDMDVIS